MKTTLKATIGVIFISSLANGATVNISNVAGDIVSSRIAVDSTNTVISSGFAAVGYFSTLSTTLDFEGASAATLATDFNILGSSTNDFQDTTFGDPIFGAFSLSATGATTTGGVGDDFVGKLAYIVISNGATLATSTEAFIFATGVNFLSDPSTPVTIDLSVDPFTTDGNPSTGTILLGSVDGTANVFLGATDLGAISNGIKTAVLVPEPSSLLLSTIGALALLRRRR